MSATCCPYVNLLPNGEWPVWVRPTFLRLTCCDLLLMQDINCTPVVNFEIHSLWTIYFHYCFLHLHMAILLNTLHLISVLLALSLGIQKVISIWLLILVWTVNLFSPWYSWKVTELAFNNNHSLQSGQGLILLIKKKIPATFVGILFIVALAMNAPRHSALRLMKTEWPTMNCNDETVDIGVVRCLVVYDYLVYPILLGVVVVLCLVVGKPFAISAYHH